MNKIDEQSDRLVHTPRTVADASSHSAEASKEDSRPAADISYSPVSTNSRVASRRVWLRRGVATASPVVASLVSAPVYAAGVCLNATGMGSIATFNSRHPNGAGVCTTQGPNYFNANFAIAGVWPTGTTTEKFKTVFGVSAGVEPGITGATTLKDVLGGGSFSELAKYTIAAYLNVQKTTTPNFPFTTVQQVFDVYKSYHGGSFSPLLVSTWSEAQTVAWLKILMT